MNFFVSILIVFLVSGCSIPIDVQLDFEETQDISAQDIQIFNDYVSSLLDENGIIIVNCYYGEYGRVEVWICSYDLVGYEKAGYVFDITQYFDNKKIKEIYYSAPHEELPKEIHKTFFYLMKKIRKEAKRIGFDIKPDKTSRSKWIEDYSDW